MLHIRGILGAGAIATMFFASHIPSHRRRRRLHVPGAGDDHRRRAFRAVGGLRPAVAACPRLHARRAAHLPALVPLRRRPPHHDGCHNRFTSCMFLSRRQGELPCLCTHRLCKRCRSPWPFALLPRGAMSSVHQATTRVTWALGHS